MPRGFRWKELAAVTPGWTLVSGDRAVLYGDIWDRPYFVDTTLGRGRRWGGWGLLSTWTSSMGGMAASSYEFIEGNERLSCGTLAVWSGTRGMLVVFGLGGWAVTVDDAGALGVGGVVYGGHVWRDKCH